MNRERAINLIFWALAVLWCVVIFMFSGENGGESSRTSGNVCYKIAQAVIWNFEDLSYSEQNSIAEGLQFFVRKAAHFCAYAFLAFLIALANRTKKPLTRGAVSIGLTAAYAVTDELHQLFVSGRNGQLSDVVLDTVGGAAGFLAAWALICIIAAVKRKYRKSTT